MPDPTAEDLIAADAFAALLDAKLVSTDPLSVRMTVRPDHCNFRGTAHGAVVYGLADIVLGVASNTTGSQAFMIDSHLVATSRAEPGDVLTATGELLSLGKTLGTWRVDVCNQDGRTVGLFTGTVIRR